MRQINWLPHTPFEICDPEGRWPAVAKYTYSSAETDTSNGALCMWAGRDFSDCLPNHEEWPETVRLGATQYSRERGFGPV